MIRMVGAPSWSNGQVGKSFWEKMDDVASCVDSFGTNCGDAADDNTAETTTAEATPIASQNAKLAVLAMAADAAQQCPGGNPLMPSACSLAVVKVFLFAYQPWIDDLKTLEANFAIQPTSTEQFDKDAAIVGSKYGDAYHAAVVAYANKIIAQVSGGAFQGVDPHDVLAALGTSPPGAGGSGGGSSPWGSIVDPVGPAGGSTTAPDPGASAPPSSDGPGLATYLVGGTLAAAAAWSAWRLYKHQPIVPAGVKRAFR